MSAEELLRVARLEAELARVKARAETFASMLTAAGGAIDRQRQSVAVLRSQVEDLALGLRLLEAELAETAATLLVRPVVEVEGSSR